MTRTFILGNPRSGTSLFRLMLQQHHNIVAPPESGFAHWWYEKYGNWSVDDVSNVKRIEEFVLDVSRSKKIETWELEFEELKILITNQKPSNYAALISWVYMSYKKGADLKAIVDKNNYYIKHLEDLPKIWPEARYIQLVRDGRDVACSYLDIEKLKTTSKYKPQLSTDLVEIAQEWQSNNRKIKMFGASQGTRFLMIRYEDLIVSTEETLKKVCAFLQVDFEEKMLNYYRNKLGGLAEPSATLDWKLKTKEKPDSSRIGRFKKSLTKNQINTFNNEALEMLRFFNYE